MEKQISKMNISTDILNGVTKQLVTCPYCKKQFSIQLINKHKKQKIITTKCISCNKNFTYGDIYNFDTGNKLNKRLENYNQETYDKYEWDNNYDKI